MTRREIDTMMKRFDAERRIVQRFALGFLPHTGPYATSVDVNKTVMRLLKVAK
jgi:hypothetical protein